MSENLDLPKKDEAILGGQFSLTENSAVLGGVEGVKQRLTDSSEETKFAAVRDATKYGQVGENLLFEIFSTTKGELRWRAFILLWEIVNEQKKQVLALYLAKLLKNSVSIWNEWRQKNINFPVQFVKINLSNLNLSKVNLSDVDMKAADLSNTNLSHANLSHADLRQAIIDRADLRCANLRYANLFKADFNQVKLEGADLSNANLSEARLGGAEFRGVNLSNANFRHAYLHEAKLGHAILDNTDFRGVTLTRAMFDQNSTSWEE